MADPKAVYGMAIGATKILAFRAPIAIYDTLKDNLGLVKLDSAAELAKAIFTPAANAGLTRLAVVFKDGIKQKTGHVWCNPVQFSTFLANPSGTFRGKAIDRVYQPLDSNRR